MCLGQGTFFCMCPQMDYKVTVATGTSEYSGTNNYIYITLVGEKGESERTVLDNPGLDFCRGAVSSSPQTELLSLTCDTCVDVVKRCV